jgi:WW domain
MVDVATLPDTVWVEYFTDTNKSYFYNKETKQTTWKVPSDYLLWKETAVKAYLKTTNWKRTVDKKDKVYYYDKVTKVTQWDVPGDVIDFEMGLLKANLQRHETRKRKAKDVTADLKERAADVAPLIEKALKDDSNFEATIPVSKIRKRVAEVDDEYESNNNTDQLRKDIPTPVPAEDLSGRFEKKIGAKNRVVNNDYTDSDHEEHYSQESDEYKGQLEHQKISTGEKETDYQTVSEGQKLQDEETAFFNNDDDRDLNADDKYLAQQEGSPAPEQKTPQYQESTPQGTPQYQETTPQGTPQYQESTPQGTPQYQETTPQGTPQYQEATPQGTPDNEYGGYGNDEANEDLKERAGRHAEGTTPCNAFSVPPVSRTAQ